MNELYIQMKRNELYIEMKEIIYRYEMKQIIYIQMNGIYLLSHLVLKTAMEKRNGKKY